MHNNVVNGPLIQAGDGPCANYLFIVSTLLLGPDISLEETLSRPVLADSLVADKLTGFYSMTAE